MLLLFIPITIAIPMPIHSNTAITTTSTTAIAMSLFSWSCHCTCDRGYHACYWCGLSGPRASSAPSYHPSPSPPACSCLYCLCFSEFAHDLILIRLVVVTFVVDVVDAIETVAGVM